MAFKNRFITRHRPIDWREILIKVNAAGMSYDSIGEAIGASGNSLRHIVSKDYGAPTEWNAAFALLDLFSMLHETDGRLDLPTLT